MAPPGSVVHGAAFTRGAIVVHETMAGHRPEVWTSDRYSAQQGRAARQQICPAHLKRKARFADENSDDLVAWRIKTWLDRAFALVRDVSTLAPSTIKTRRRKLERDLDALLAEPAACSLAAELQAQFSRAREQLLTFCDFPGMVEATNNACERDLRPAVIQRKVTNAHHRAKWGTDHSAAVRTAIWRPLKSCSILSIWNQVLRSAFASRYALLTCLHQSHLHQGPQRQRQE